MLAADTSKPEIRTENFDKKANFNENLGNDVKVNQSSEPGILEQKDNANLGGADNTKEIENRKPDKAPDNNAEAQELIEMISSDKEGYKKSLSFWDRFSAFLKSIFVFTFKNASGAQFKDVLAKKRVESFVNQLKDKNLFENFCKDTVSRISQEQNLERARYLAAFIGIVIDNGYVEIDADGQNVSKQYLNFVQNLAGEIRKARGNTNKGEILSSLLTKTLNRVNREGKFGDLIENLVDDLLPNDDEVWHGQKDEYEAQIDKCKIENFKCLIDPDYFNIPGLIEYLADKIESSSNKGDIKILGDLLRTALFNSYGEEIEKVKVLKPGDEYVPSKELGELMHYFYRSGKHVWQELKKLTGIAPDDLLQKMYKSAENYLMFEVKSKSEMENCLSFIEPCTFPDASRFVEIGKQKLERKEYAPIIPGENFEKLGKAFEKCVNSAFGRVIDEKMKKLDEAKKEEKQKWEAIKAEWDNEETAHTFEKRSEVYVNIRKNLDEDFIDSLQKEIEKTFLGFMKDGSDLPNIIGFERDLEALAIIGALCTSKFFLTFEGEMNVQYFAKNMQKAYEASKAQQSAGDGAEVKPNEV